MDKRTRQQWQDEINNTNRVTARDMELLKQYNAYSVEFGRRRPGPQYKELAERWAEKIERQNERVAKIQALIDGKISPWW